MKELVYNGQTIHTKDADMLSLTDMWRAADCPSSRGPYEWSRKEGRQFIDFIAQNLNTPVGRIYKAARGKGGQTFAHWQIGFAYAQYLSHEFHAWCNDVVRQHMEGLAKRQEVRQRGKDTRKEWAYACVNKGADQRGIAAATNAMYGVFFGGKTAKQLREVVGLKKSEPLRDHMRMSTLAGIMLTEALAAETIQTLPCHGVPAQDNRDCITATRTSAGHVTKAMSAVRKERRLIEME